MSDQTSPAARRHWGPFTGGHLAAMFIALVIAVGFPFAAFAVTGNNVFVTDASTGMRAKVNAAGQLNVAATPRLDSLYRRTGNIVVTSCQTDPCTLVAKPPAGKALIIDSVHLGVFGTSDPPAGSDEVFLMRSSNGTCNLNSLENSTNQTVVVGRIGELELSYPSGLAIASGKALCVFKSNTSQVQTTVTAYGYSVPATAVAG